MHTRILYVIVFAIGCTVRQDSKSNPVSTTPIENQTSTPRHAVEPSRFNPKDEMWPDLIGKHVEVIGKLTPRSGAKGDLRDTIFFNGTYLEVKGNFDNEAFAADQIRVSGILTREHHSLAPLGGQGGMNGRVYETFLLNVEKWEVSDGQGF